MDAQRRVKVLLVEDDDDTPMLLAELLSDEFDVSTAADGALALELLEQTSPDVLVTDESLPGIQGTALAKTVKERWPQIRVVLVSGYTRLPGSGACDVVLNKPVDVEVLSKVLEDLSAPGLH